MIPQIFVSYSRKDANFTRKLVDDLTIKGIDIWLDQRDIKAGERWDTAVQNALKQSDYFMVVLSPESVSSENVLDEIAYAMSKNKHVFPILVEDCDVPYRLARVQYVDFRGSYEKGIGRLLEQMQIAGVPISGEVTSGDGVPRKSDEMPVAVPRREADQPSKKSTTKLLAAGAGGVILLMIVLLVVFSKGFPFFAPASTETPAVALAATTAAPDSELGTHTELSPAKEATPTLPTRPTTTNSPTITPSPVPRIVRVQYCDKPCDQAGAKFVTKYPEKTKYIYFALNYQDFYPDMPYTRVWSQRGEEWIRYDCAWQGTEDGTFPLMLYDTKGLRSGTWILQFYISGDLVAESHIEIEGTYDYWDPAGVRKCRDF